MNDWTQIASQLGIPVAVMAVLGFGIWRAGKAVFSWGAPLVQKAVESQVETNKKHAESAGTSADALKQLVPICEASKRIAEKLDDGHEVTSHKVEEIHKMVKDIHENLK